MIHVYPLATAFNVDDEKDDNDDENSWIITCNSCSQKRRRQRNFTIKEIAYPFSKNGICDSKKTDIPFGGMACAIFRQCAD